MDQQNKDRLLWDVPPGRAIVAVCIECIEKRYHGFVFNDTTVRYEQGDNADDLYHKYIKKREQGT